MSLSFLTEKFDALPECKNSEDGADFPEDNDRKKREDLSETVQTVRAPVCNLMQKFDSVSLLGSSASRSQIKRDEEDAGLPGLRSLDQSDSGIEGLDQSGLGIACLDQSTSDADGLDLSDPGFWRKWQKKQHADAFEDQSVSDEYLTADEGTGSLPERADDLGTFRHDGRRNRHNSGSTCSSYKSIQSSSWDASNDQSMFFEG